MGDAVLGLVTEVSLGCMLRCGELLESFKCHVVSGHVGLPSRVPSEVMSCYVISFR